MEKVRGFEFSIVSSVGFALLAVKNNGKEPKVKIIRPPGKDKPPRPKIRGSIFKRQPPLPRR